MDTQLLLPGSSSFPSWQLWTYWKDPLDFLSDLANKYGDLAQFRVGPRRIYLVNHPDYIENILEGDQACFTKGVSAFESEMAYPTHARLSCQDILGFQGLDRFELGLDDQRLADCESTAVVAALRVSDRWENLQSVNVRKEMRRLVIRSLAETFFGECDDERLEQLERMTAQLRPDPLAMEFPLAGRLRRLRFSKYKSGMMENTELQHITIPCLVVCQTLADSLAWTLRLLAEHPDVLASLHSELDCFLMGLAPTLNDLERLVYARMVMAEVLRLYPPVRVIRRLVIRDLSLDDYMIPATAEVLISPWVMQRDPRYYPEAGRFDPQRWTPASISGRPRYAYLPFGGGARACPGEEFVWVTASLTLATLAQRWQFQLMPGKAKHLKTKTSRWPKNGARLQIQRRASNSYRL